MKCSVPRNHLEGDQEGLARHITCNAACKHTCPSAFSGQTLLEACYDKQEMAQKVTMGDIRDALAFFSDSSASAEQANREQSVRRPTSSTGLGARKRTKDNEKKKKLRKELKAQATESGEARAPERRSDNY